MTVLDEQPLLDDPSTEAGAPAGGFDFDGFVARHGLRLRRVVARRTGDHHEAEEVLQEALLRAYQHRHSFTDDDGAAAWTTVVAQRLAVDRHRVARRSLAVAEVPESGRVDRDTADVVIASSEARAALDVLGSLPRRQAAILWAREVEGLSYAEIAQRLELTEPTVRTALSRARQALRKEFVRRGHAVPAAGLVPFAPALLALRGGEELGRPVRRFVEAKALAAAAAAAVLAAGVVTAGAPWIAAVVPDRVTPSSSGTSRLLQLPPAPGAGATAPAAPAAPAADVAAVPATRAQAPGSAGGRSRPVVPLDPACASAAGTSACLDDDPPAGDVLVVELPVPLPGDVDRPGVQTDILLDCDELPSLPLTSCKTSPDNGDRR